MQQWHNAVPSDEEWPFGRNLLTQSFGTPVTWDWRRRWGIVTVFSPVAQCSVVDKHHYRYPFCHYLLHWWKHMFLWKLGVCLQDCTASHANSDEEENITSHKMQEDPLADNMPFTRDSNRGVLHVICCMLLCVECGKHSVREANVDHHKLPSVVSDTNVWALCLVSKCETGCSMHIWCLFQDMQVCSKSCWANKAKEFRLDYHVLGMPCLLPGATA